MRSFEPGEHSSAAEQELHEFLPLLATFRFHLRSFLSFSEQRAEALGTTAQQYQMLQVLANTDENGCSVSYLASRLLLRHNSAVELVDRAERSGLVQRLTDQNDLRRSLLQLTPRGRKLLWQLVSEHVYFLQDQGPALAKSLLRLLDTPCCQGTQADV